MAKQTNKRLIISVNQKMMDMIEDLMEANGLSTKTESVRQAIAFHHSKTFPAYKQVPGRNKRDKERDGFREAQDICDALGGTIIESSPGAYSCKYNTSAEYANGKKVDYPVTVPVENLNWEMVEK